jgi:predicted ATP-grasp superfamily ATP-dependent carboligase
MRVLLSDGTGMTARQVATHLASNGHEVHVLSAAPVGLTRFTKHVRHLHRVPAYGHDPRAWLDRAVAVLARERIDVLLPTHEQVAVLSREASRVAATGVRTAVPSFRSLRRLQDKVAAYTTLQELRLPQPKTRIVRRKEQLRACDQLPVYIKAAIGTASAGVRYVADRATLERVAAELDDQDFADGILVQQPISGPLAMVQAVFFHGELIAWHANVRVRAGAGGGAAIKRSICLPQARADVGTLGRALGWHGALSLDAILTEAGPRYIDVNPRLVEPGNAWHAGTNLSGALLRVALGERPEPFPCAEPGRKTHQLVVALLGAAQHSSSRRSVISEAQAAIRGAGDYRESVEELTPTRHDWLAGLPVLAVGLALVIRPAVWRSLAANAVARHALTREAWQSICVGFTPQAEERDSTWLTA